MEDPANLGALRAGGLGARRLWPGITPLSPPHFLLTQSIAEQIAYVRDWGGKLVVPIPEATVLE